MQQANSVSVRFTIHGIVSKKQGEQVRPPFLRVQNFLPDVLLGCPNSVVDWVLLKRAFVCVVWGARERRGERGLCWCVAGRLHLMQAEASSKRTPSWFSAQGSFKDDRNS
jgi:hypothetical protein